jgi:DNA-binding NarL/FixJ family response regulator
MKAPPSGTAPNGRRTILLVDDHPFMREGMAKRIQQEPGLAVCGEAARVDEARRAIVRLRPDVVVLDLSLADCLALDFIKDIKTLVPDSRILVFTMHDEAVYAERALRAGAHGYVMKQEPPERLVAALHAVLRGEYCVSKDAETGIMRSFLNPSWRRGARSVNRLTNRELEVFHLLGQGLGTQDIAVRLGRSVKTIETHRARIKEKLHLKTAAELISSAGRWLATNQKVYP